MTNTCDTKNISEVPVNTSNEVYFKGLLHKSFSGQDIINLLTNNGYCKKEDVYTRKLSNEQRLNMIFTLYQEVGKNYYNDKEYIDNLLSTPYLYDEYFKFASTTEEAYNSDISIQDIKKLTDFANLANGKIGEFLKKDFDYTLFIFNLMKHNNLFDRFMFQSEKQPAVLESVLKLLENKPSVDEIKSLNNYKSLSAFSINAYLRGSSVDEKFSQDSRTIIKVVDEYLNKFESKTPLKLIRGDHSYILQSLQMKDSNILLICLFDAMRKQDIEEINKICSMIKESKPQLINKGYISTSLDRDLDRDIRWNLTVKPEVKSVYVDLRNLLSQDTCPSVYFWLPHTCFL